MGAYLTPACTMYVCICDHARGSVHGRCTRQLMHAVNVTRAAGRLLGAVRQPRIAPSPPAASPVHPAHTHTHRVRGYPNAREGAPTTASNGTCGEHAPERNAHWRWWALLARPAATQPPPPGCAPALSPRRVARITIIPPPKTLSARQSHAKPIRAPQHAPVMLEPACRDRQTRPCAWGLN